MNRSMCVRAIAAMAMVFCCASAFGAISYTSSGSGYWDDSSKWSPAGVPGAGDTVTIANSDTITVRFNQTIDSVAFSTGTGTHTLVIDGATLTVEALTNAFVIDPVSSIGTNETILQNNGILTLSNGSMTINGGPSSLARVTFASTGGTLNVAGDIVFTGTQPNAQIDFGSGAAEVYLAGDLGNGGNIIPGSGAFIFNGAGTQTINSYTFNDFKINKSGGTATLNGPITVDGAFRVDSGVLDDGGYQIDLNAGGTSDLKIGSTGVLKLGSASAATTFPAPLNAANVVLDPGSAVDYQAGVAQTLDTSFDYQRLYVTTTGGSSTKTFTGTLHAQQELNVGSNVTLQADAEFIDADADITGTGTVSLTSGAISIAGSFDSTITLLTGSGSTVTYDGSGAQNVLAANYENLSIIKGGGTATLTGNAVVAGNFKNGVIVGIARPRRVTSHASALTTGTFDAGGYSMVFEGNFENHHTVLAGSAAFQFSGTALQFVTSDSPLTIGTVTINNAMGVSMVDTTSVTTSLNLTQGKLTVADFFVDVLASITRTNGWVVGPLTLGMNASPSRTFPIGTTAAYLPVTVDAGSAGTLTIEAVEGQHPNATGINLLDRYWKIRTPATITSIDTVTFSYNASDVQYGTESQYVLAYRDGSGWHLQGDVVNEGTHLATLTSVSSYLGDWAAGQRGSLGHAATISVVSVNGGLDPQVSTPFDVVIEGRDDNDTLAPVDAATTITLSVLAGSGALGGANSGTIAADADTVTISGVTYDVVENGVVFRATAGAGDPLGYADSPTFNVTGSSTVTVTNVNDSGAGSLRDAIATANSGACPAPCTIEFSVSGTIVLSSALPAIVVNNLTIDGYTAPGSSPNTNAFGSASNAVITMAVDGNNSVGTAFDIQGTFDKIKGLAIRGFTGAAVQMTGDNSGSNVSGCYIGTDNSGTVASPNGSGINLTSSTESSVGGSAPADRNVISGNTNNAIDVQGTSNTVSIIGNYLGVKANLSGALPNAIGVNVVNGASSVAVGSSSTGNVISGNSNTGVATDANGVTIEGNLIGTAGTAAAAIGNLNGIFVGANATNTTIGGTSSPSQQNTISGNNYGVVIYGNSTTLDQNLIGIASNGTTALGNTANGITFYSSAANNTVGVTYGNAIANNQNGIVFDSAATGAGNAIRKNRIFSNAQFGIDLKADGVTANDGGDSDSGPNNLQNFPTIAAAQKSGSNLVVTLSADSASVPSTGGFVIDFFKADGSTNPQAQTWLGDSGCLAGNSLSNTTVTIVAGSIALGDKIVATATSYNDAACTTINDGTSELSAAATVTAAPIHWIGGTGAWETGSNWDSGSVPGAGDSVAIDQSGTYTVTLSSNAAVASLVTGTGTSGQQTLAIAGGASLTLANASSVATTGVISHAGSALTASGGLDVDGKLDWDGAGTITGAGGINIDGSLNINNAVTRVLESLVTVGASGAVNWNAGNLTLQNGGGFDNYGMFEALTDGTISDGGSDAGFDNFNLFRKSVTTGVTTFNGVDLNNSGTIALQTGSLNPTAGTSTGAITLASGTEMTFDALTYTLGTSTSVSGLGKLHVTGGTLTVSGSASIDNIALDAGTINGSGAIALGGQLAWTGGLISGSGAITLSSASVVNVSGASSKLLDGRTLSLSTSGATMNLGGTGTFALQNAGSISIASGATLDLPGDTPIYDNGSDGGIVNAGLLRKSAGTLTQLNNVDLTNSGTLRVAAGVVNGGNITNSGTIDLIGGDLQIDLGDTVNFNTGTSVTGSGIVHVGGGTLNVNDVIAIPSLDLTSGTLSGTGALSASTLTWSGGIMSGSGSTTIPNAATLTVSGTSSKVLSRTLSIANGGTSTWGGSNTIFIQNGGAISNAGAMSITQPLFFSDNGSAGDITNSGTLTINTAGTAWLFVTLNTSGSLTLTNGSLNLFDGTSSGPITIGASSTLIVDDSSYSFAAGTTVSGAGAVSVPTGGTLSIDTDLSIANFDLSGGTLTGASALSLTGTADWSSGTMSGSGITAAISGGALTLSGSSSKLLTGRALNTNNTGTISITGGGTITMQSGASITNNGTFAITGNGAITNGGAAGSIANWGTWSKSGSAGTTTLANVNFTNNSLVDLQTGTFAFSGGTFTQTAGSTLKLTLGGTVAGVNYAQLTSTTTPSLAGTLQIALQGVYQPVGGDSFRVLAITGGAHTGDFTTDTYPPLSSGRTFSRAYDASGLLLSVSGTSDVSITKSAPASVATGGAISYTLTVNNAGPDLATAVTVTDTLPAGHTGISASGTGWNCNVVSLTVTCTATSSLAAGNANAITINATAPATPQTFINTANVSASNDTNNTNDSGTATVTVSATDADLSVSVIGPAAPVSPATPVTFTFTVANTGPATATSVTFGAAIPSSFTFNSATPGSGSCNFAAGSVSCTLGTINSGNSVNVVLSVSGTTAGTFSITGGAGAAEADSVPDNNSAMATASFTGNVVTVTSDTDSGDGTLRQALTDAQNGVCTAPCTIQFALPATPASLALVTLLPIVADNTTIDGTTQSGYTSSPVVILDGQGLHLGSNSTVKGLAIANATTAILISGSNNTVRDCYLGLDGGQNAGTGSRGVIIDGNSNTIDSNVISGNALSGVTVQGTASGNTIQGNRIGTDAAGTSARPNAVGVSIDGTSSVAARMPHSNSITTGTTLTNNTISNNTGDGVSIGSAADTLIQSNTIANNGDDGIVVTSGTANRFLQNSIFANAGQGIDLGDENATANDSTDSDSGANGLQNFPAPTGAYLTGGGGLTVTYDLNSSGAPAGSVHVEIFKADASGQGKTFLASACIAGNWFSSGTSFSAPSIVAGDKIVLTATSFSDSACGTVSDGTSEFSGSATVTNCTPPPVTITGATSSCAGAPVTLDAGAGFAEYLWSTGAITQTITVSPTSTQTYSVTVKDGIGCSNSDTHTVTVTSNPVVSITTAAGVCAGSSNNNASVGAVAGATYNWTVTNGTLDSGQGTNAITYTAGPSGSVGISVSVTSSSCTGSGSTSVPISTPPSVMISGPASVCPNTPFILDAGSGFTSYLWSNGATTQTISVQQSAATATYTVTVTSGGCSASDTHVVTLTANPQAAISAPNSAAPSATYTATVQAQTGATYNWSVANGSLLSGDGTDSITFKTGATGQTELSVSINVGGCTATDVHYVNISGGSTGADLAISKAAVTTITAGANLTYTIGVANHGPANASGITITDTLPAGTSLVSFNDGPWTCAFSSGTLTCTGSAAAGASSAISVVVTAPQDSGTITNTATITSSTSDPDPSNNSASATTNVVASSPSCTTTPPALITPSGGAFVDSPVAFSWTTVPGATLYEVWLAGDTPQLLGSTTSTSFTAQLPNGGNAWYVVAHLAGGCLPLTSQSATFNVNEANNCATHGAPQLSAPSPGATLASLVTFAWMPVPQAIGYRVWIESNGTAAQDIGTTDGAITLTANVPAGATVAYVDALFSGCPATRSQSITFTAQTPSPCENRTAATLVAPANNATLNTSAIDFSWLAAANASGYRVWASVDGGTPAVLGTTVDDTTLHANVANGSVVWWVEALYDGCASVDSAPRNFTIPPSQQCGTITPSLLAPASDATLTDANVQFSWSSVPNAIAYELWLALDHGTPVLAGTTSATSLARVVAPGTIEWFVRAIVDRCPPRDSQSSTFTYEPPASCSANDRPIAVEPINGASVTAPVDFHWTAPAGATRYELYVARGNQPPVLIASGGQTIVSVPNLTPGKLRWFVRAFFGDDCPALDSAEQPLEIVAAPAACASLTAPVISVPGQISSGTPFTIYWTPSAGATSYQLQVATRADFDDAQTFTTTATSLAQTRTNNGATPAGLYARVRALDARCQPTPSVTPFGPTSAFFILPPSGIDGSAPVGGDGIVHFTIPLGPELAGQTFTATPKAPWLTVTPSSGVVAPGGTTLDVTAGANALPLGTSLGAISVILNAASGRVTTNATTVSPTFSVSLVTPVTPQPKNTPPPDALIIPAVAHADGINSKFQSDVRVSNTSPQVIKYQLTFTPSGITGIGSGSQTTFSIEPGRTIALDDILQSWFGTGNTSTTGTLEIRPLTQTTTTTPNSALSSSLANLVTFASSRTSNATSNGTFGQYIPAVPFANFVGFDAARKKIISLQQIAQSDRYRTNLGLVEGSGQPASLLIKVFGDAGQKLTEFPVTLNGGQHTQLNGFLASNGITSLNDGRVEIEVTSPNGKVTAYASVLDNVTSDPLLVTPVQLNDEGDTKWVLPGAADLNNGFANWQTDMRVFNAGATDVDATLAFYSQNGGEPRIATVTIPAGQVRQFDKTVSTLFGATNDGGAVHITTAAPSRLIATARTYNQTTGGTYGQFISAVTPAESAGLGSRPLQILQVEESTRFRSNIGLAEVTGNPVRVEIAVVPPDAKFTAVAQLDLQPNEFRQIGSLLKSVGLGDTFNARVTVRVLEGAGRVTAYASVIDAITNDPTYIPAQ